MNEQIRNFAMKSGLGEHLWLNNSDPTEEESVEKFAKLIIEEAAEMVAGYYDERTMQWAGPRIKQHFGVE